MLKLKFLFIHSCFATALFACFTDVSGQQASMATNPSATPFFQSTSLAGEGKREMDFTVGSIGSVKGRIFSDAELAENAAGQHGIAGVKLALRSRDAPFLNWRIERYTDDSGSYFFEDLRPGKYYIEIHPSSLPPKFRTTEVVEPMSTVKLDEEPYTNIPVIPQRMITGQVFTDEDGNGEYKKGKDTPIAGALITVGGKVAISDGQGRYVLHDLPAGRTSLVVRWPNKAETTHVLFDLGNGRANTVVNVPTSR